MKFLITIFALSAALIIFTFSLYSRPERVQQVPNGSKYQCLTCHTSSSGGSRNAFGLEVQMNFLQSGRVVWGEALAALDSDGDGFSNGEELLDPNGTWTSGNQSPGNSEDVGNPGDPTSRPNISSVFGNFENQAYNIIELYNAYPNPFISGTNINYQLNQASDVLVTIYDETGALIFENNLGFMPEGNYDFNWNGTNILNEEVSRGIYFLYIQAQSAAVMQKIIK